MENLEEEELLILIGEKIEIKKLPYDKEDCTSTHCYDKFAGRYKVIKKICGNYNKNEITFLIDGYYDKPYFADYTNCLFYLSRKRNSKDTFALLTYEFDDVYRTKDGEWASPFSSMNYRDYDSTKGKIKPRRIDYAEEVTYNVKGFSRNRLNQQFPSPYFTINNKIAIAKYGNYVEELVQMKKEGLLKSWGYYGPRDTTEKKVKVQDVTLSDIKQEEEIQYNKNEVVDAFYNFFKTVKKTDLVQIRKKSMPNVICSVCEEPPRFDYENNFETIDSFVISAFRFIRFSQLEQEIENRTYTVSVEKRDTSHTNHAKSNEINIYKISFTTYSDIEDATVKQAHDFEFIKSNGILLFYGMRSNIKSYFSIEDRIRISERYFKKSN